MLILDHDPCGDRSDLLLRLLWGHVLCLLQASHPRVRLDLVTILYNTTTYVLLIIILRNVLLTSNYFQIKTQKVFIKIVGLQLK